MNATERTTETSETHKVKSEPMILRLNLEIDVDDFTLLQFSALTDAISHACNIDRKRLRSIRQPKESSPPVEHVGEKREARREILAILRKMSDGFYDTDKAKNTLTACREYLEAEEDAEAP